MTFPVVHVGLHKTGTTWLQDHLFCNEQAGYFDVAARIGRKALLDTIVRPTDLAFDAGSARATFAAEVDHAREQGLVPVLTHERLSGYPPGGSADRTIIARRIAATFDEPRVLLVIREQISLIDSLYGQYVADGGHLPLRRFLAGPRPRIGRIPSFSLDVFEFHRLVTFYREMFGDRNVLVLPHELMAHDIQGFADAIANFSGAPSRRAPKIKRSNSRRPMLMQGVRRFANGVGTRNELSDHGLATGEYVPGLFRRMDPAFRRLVPAAIDRRLARRQTEQIQDFVGTAYAASNRGTSELIGRDLGELGYQI